MQLFDLLKNIIVRRLPKPIFLQDEPSLIRTRPIKVRRPNLRLVFPPAPDASDITGPRRTDTTRTPILKRYWSASGGKKETCNKQKQQRRGPKNHSRQRKDISTHQTLLLMIPKRHPLLHNLLPKSIIIPRPTPTIPPLLPLLLSSTLMTNPPPKTITIAIILSPLLFHPLHNIPLTPLTKTNDIHHLIRGIAMGTATRPRPRVIHAWQVSTLLTHIDAALDAG